MMSPSPPHSSPPGGRWAMARTYGARLFEPLDDRSHPDQFVAGRQTKVGIAAAMVTFGGLWTLITAADLSTPDTRWQPVGVGVIGVLLGVSVALGWRHVTDHALHLVVAFGTAMVIAAVVMAQSGPSLAMSFGFMVWVVMYVSCFLSPRAATEHSLVGYAVLAIVVSIRHPQYAMLLIVATMLTGVVVGGSVGWLAQRLRQAALLDPMTGVGNATAWASVLSEEIDRSDRSGEPLSVAFIDLDGLKALNDGHGHAEGDLAISDVAQSLRRGLRRSDFAARLGGDEFAVLMPRTDIATAQDVLGRIRTACVTSFSVGAAQRHHGESAGPVTERADAAMYEMKRRTRGATDVIDAVIAASEPESTGPESTGPESSGRELAGVGRSVVDQMEPLDDVIAPPSSQIAILVAMLLVGGLFAVVASPAIAFGANRYAIAAGGAIAVALGSVLLTVRRMVGSWVRHAALFVGTGLIVSVIGLVDGTLSAAVGSGFMVWVAVFAACFFSLRWTAVHVAVAYVLLGVAIEIAHSAGVRIIAGAAVTTGTVVAICLMWLASRLRQNATVDGLTGLVNGRAWREALDRELLRSQRTGAALSVAFIDVDGLKQVNDEHGHAEGDRAISAVAESLRTGMGQHDVVARVGGDEFVVLLPDSTANHAEAAITRVRASSTVPFSIGVAERRDGEDAQEVISRADQAMYEQKRVRRAGPSESDASLDPIPSR